MTKTLNQIVEWIQTRPFWEQAILKMHLDGKAPQDEDYEKLIQWCLEDKKLNTINYEKPVIDWKGISPNSSNSSKESVKLKKIFDLQNVNALTNKQSLTFHPNLTLIYGANGSGKSGYSRILANLGFSRGDIKILPNVFSEKLSSEPEFDLELEINGEIKNLHFEIGKEFQRIGGVYVFDSSSVEKHITKSEKISFSPSGLKYLTKLSDVITETVKNFETTFGEYSKSHSFERFFQGESEVKELIGKLDIKSEFKRLEELSNVSKANLNEETQLESKIADLRIRSVDIKISDCKKKIEDLEGLVKKLSQAEESLSKDIVSQVEEEIKNFLVLKSKTSEHGLERFQSSEISNIGTNEWHQFIDAAIAFAKTQESYPNNESECLLCYQKLTPESLKLINSLQVFLQEDLQDKLREMELNISNRIKNIQQIDLSFFKENEIGYNYLSETSLDLVTRVCDFINVSKNRKELIIKSLQDFSKLSLKKEHSFRLSEIKNHIILLENEIKQLTNSNPKLEIEECEKKLTEIKHRVTLKANWDLIKEYKDKKEWHGKSKKALGTTVHITKKYNELFKSLVTDHYIALFKQILKELNCPMNVEISTRGEKGKVLRKIVLTHSRDKNTPDQILSEGEKRAVAIADFLTEATLDENSAVMVLDDPITSLDYDWKDIMAKRLISEAEDKQVIIFTHDLPFLFQLKKYCKEKDLECFCHTIERGVDDSPGYIQEDYVPESVEEYKSTVKAEELLKKSKHAASPEESKLFLQQGFNALRATYEAFVIYKLFEGTIRRFDRHIKIGNLKNVCLTTEILEKVVDKFGYLSGFTGGHLSSNFQMQTPKPEILQNEIEDFQKLQKELKELKKKKTSKN